MNPQAFARAIGRMPRRIPFANFIPETPKPLDREALPHYWHPDRMGVEHAPGHFRNELLRIHPDLACCRPPANAPTPSHAWLVWYKKPAIRHELSPGWLLLFVWQEREEIGNGHPDRLTPLPLDNRVFANLYRISAGAWGGAMGYFKGVVQTLEADRARKDEANDAWKDDHAKDYRDFMKIKSSGRGNKAALHHSGTIVPSRGELLWRQEIHDRMLPSEVVKDRRDRVAKMVRKSRRR